MKITDAMWERLGRLVVRDNAPLGLLIDTRYEVLDRLARGGMGEIFRARDLRLNRPVAMKILASSLADPEWAARFEDEARTMSRIDHPGIVPIHDLGLLPDGRLFYTMKLIDGNTLEELLQAGEERKALLEALARTCEIVHHAHERGVIHRDLKPSNVMLGRDGQIYVLDWGIARVRQEIQAPGGKPVGGAEGYTSAGMVLGTLPYMPPEQARADTAAIDARSDVYALGAILYEVLTGVPPVQGESVTEMLEKATKGSIEPPRTVDPSLPPDLEAICLKAVNRSRRLRYASAMELADDLRRWLCGDPVRAYSAGLRYRLSKIVRKRRWQVATAGVMLAGLVGFGIYWVSHRGDRALAEAKLAEDEIWGPIRKRLQATPATPEGHRRALRLVDDGLRQRETSWDGWMMKADAHEKLGEVDAALAAFARAFQLNPRLSQACYRRGRIFMDVREDMPRAREEFEKALRVDPDNEFALLGRARGAATAEDFPGALALCQKAEPLSRHLSDFFFLRGYLRTADYAGPIRNSKLAIEDFAQALKMEPGRAVTHVNLGLAYLNSGESSRAVEEFDRAIKLDPSLSGAYANRGIVRHERGDLAGALADYTKAIDLKADNSNAYTKRGNVLRDQGNLTAALADHTRAIELNPRNAAAYGNRGNVRQAKGDHAVAIADCEKAVEIRPEDASLRANLGNAYLARGDANRALACYQRALELDPQFAAGYVNRGVVRGNQGDLTGAIADFSRAAELAPRLAKAWSSRGLARKMKGDLEGGLADLTRAVELDPKLAEAWYHRALFRSRKGDVDGAIADYTKALEVSPRDGAAWNNRALLRQQKGDLAGAQSDYDKAIEVEPTDTAAWFNRGNVKSERGDVEGAIADYAGAIERNPHHFGAYVHRGSARQGKGDLEGAIADASRAIEIDPSRAEAYTNRGLARKEKGDLQGALADQTKAIELKPRDPIAYVNRAGLRRALGDREGRVADLRKALEVAPAGWSHRAQIERLLGQAEKPE